MNQSTKLLVIGAGSMAKDIADLVNDIPGHEVIGFVIDQPPFERHSLLAEKPILWVDEVEDLNYEYKAICGISHMKKIDIIKKVKSFHVQFVQLIHPSSRVSSSVFIGEGVVINSGVHIATSSTLGDFVYVNRGSLIGHDTSIGALSVISPGVNIAGNVTIGKNSFIGMGAIITERVKIGEGCFICAGSLVTKDLPDRVKVTGVPAQVIERDIG